MPAGALVEGFGRSISGCAVVLYGIPYSAGGFRVQDSRLKVCLSRSRPHTTMEAKNGNLQILWPRVHAVWRPRSASIQGPSFFFVCWEVAAWWGTSCLIGCLRGAWPEVS